MLTWMRSRTTIARTLLALFALFLVAAPTVDAIACGPELTAEAGAHAATPPHVDEAEAPVETGEAPDQHGVCQHGHCHHAQLSIDHRGGDQTAYFATPTPAGLASAAPLMSHVGNNLKRPPRA